MNPLVGLLSDGEEISPLCFENRVLVAGWDEPAKHLSQATEIDYAAEFGMQIGSRGGSEECLDMLANARGELSHPNL